MTVVPNLKVCSATEFSGIFNNAANTINNYTFTCINPNATASWAASLTSCTGSGAQNCGAGACCATRNGTLFGYPMTQS